MAKNIAIIGGGPAGLMAAEMLSASGHAVTVYDAMPTFARKFLLAGKSGLNITHSEDFLRFVGRFGHGGAHHAGSIATPDAARSGVTGTTTRSGMTSVAMQSGTTGDATHSGATGGATQNGLTDGAIQSAGTNASLATAGKPRNAAHAGSDPMDARNPAHRSYSPVDGTAMRGDHPAADATTLPDTAGDRLRPALEAFRPDDVRAWADSLGTETFVGSSGRVFPTVMKASPLLRAWLRRLEAQGVVLKPRHRWIGFAGTGLRFETPEGEILVEADATLLALGGASWPRLGSDAAWVPLLRGEGIAVRDLQPANCGFDVAWSDGFAERFAGAPLKSVSTLSDAGRFQGEFVISRHGIEGSLVYAHSAALRDRLAKDGAAALTVDLAPGRNLDRLARDLSRQDAKTSFSNRLRKGAGLEGVKAALVREIFPDAGRLAADALAGLVKALPIPLVAPRPIAEAISCAGGIAWEGVDARFMLTRRPGLFAAGEMLDWEAPTGGYLLTACLATGRAAGGGMEAWLAER